MLLFQRNIGKGKLAVWQMTENLSELQDKLEKTAEIKQILKLNSESRIKEKLAVRVLLKELIEKQVEVHYTSLGKPYLEDGSYNISISHTRNYVAVIIHPSKKVAVDIEQIAEKIKNVRSRIVSESEFIDSSQELAHLLLHWSAKECLFKYLNEEGVDFIHHLYIELFTPQTEGKFKAREERTPSKQKFDEVHYLIEKEFVLVWIAD